MTVSIVADGAGERLVFVPKVIRHDARSDASRLNEQGRGSFNRVGIAPRVSTLPTAQGCVPPVGQRLSLNYSRGERVLAPFLFVFDHRI